MSTHIAVECGEREVEQGIEEQGSWAGKRAGQEDAGQLGTAKGTTVNHAAAAWQTHPKTAEATSASVRTCYIWRSHCCAPPPIPSSTSGGCSCGWLSERDAKKMPKTTPAKMLKTAGKHTKKGHRRVCWCACVCLCVSLLAPKWSLAFKALFKLPLGEIFGGFFCVLAG